jgi:hypothetical protein
MISGDPELVQKIGEMLGAGLKVFSEDALERIVASRARTDAASHHTRERERTGNAMGNAMVEGDRVRQRMG